jgi:hypothetical protein
MPTWHIHIIITSVENQQRGNLHFHPFHPNVDENIVNYSDVLSREFTILNLVI